MSFNDLVDRVRQQGIRTKRLLLLFLDHWWTKHLPGIEAFTLGPLDLNWVCNPNNTTYDQQGILRAYLYHRIHKEHPPKT